MLKQHFQRSLYQLYTKPDLRAFHIQQKLFQGAGLKKSNANWKDVYERKATSAGRVFIPLQAVVIHKR